MKKAEEQFMRLAIDKAKEGVRRGQTPFGACIVREGKVIALSHNVVWKKLDITAHAEVTAIREACAKLRDVDLSGCTIYSTCEPCPMCFAACHWAKIGRVVYGARIADARKLGFSELTISNRRMKTLGQSPLKVEPDFLRAECLEPFKLWSQKQDKKTY